LNNFIQIGRYLARKDIVVAIDVFKTESGKWAIYVYLDKSKNSNGFIYYTFECKHEAEELKDKILEQLGE
jgi:hypothetical protein